MTLICAVIAAERVSAAEQMARDAMTAGAEALEFRLDALTTLPDDLSFLAAPLPVIATLRSPQDEERREVFARALAAGADYVDIESDSVLRNAFPQNRTICSHHDFEKTPDAGAILTIFQDLAVSGIPKAAFMVRGPADLLKIGSAASVLRQANRPFILIGMGCAGEVTRVRAGDLGSLMNYCAVTPDRASAPGQITVADAVFLGKDPIVTAITGWPLTHTKSPAVHHAAFSAAGISGRYVKIPSVAEELHLLPDLLRIYRISGINVTIPHKEAILPLLAEIDPAARAAGAVNTVVVSANGLVGYNTDIAGVAASLKKAGADPRHASALVVGAGGAARATVAYLTRAGAQVTITNRTAQKAEKLAEAFGAVAVMRDVLTPDYDIIINATPAGMSGFSSALPIPATVLSPKSVVMDMIYEPEHTAFLAAATKAGVRATIGGKTMLIEQAAASFALWTGTQADTAAMTAAFEEER